MEADLRKTTGQLKRLEDLLLVRSRTFSGDQEMRLAGAIEQLKEVLYSLDEISSIEGSAVHRLNDDLPVLVERLVSVVDGTNQDAIISVTTQVQRFYDYFTRVSQSANQNLIDQLNAAREQINQYKLQDQTRQKAEAVEDETKKAISRVKSVEASREWSTYYEKYVTQEGVSNFTRGGFKPWFARLGYWGENFYLLERKWAQWRSVWLAMLVALSLVLLIVSFAQISFGVDILRVAAEKLLAIPIYVVLGICFAFASRNFRINANLLADYRHKQIVAKVLENVVLSNALEEKDDLKVDLLQQGAKALFVAKNVGHLDKEAVEEFPIVELIKAIKK